MSDRTLTVGSAVVVEMVRLAALEVPGVHRVGRAGPWWRRAFLGRPIRARVRDGRVAVRLSLVARPGQALEPLTAQVRSAVGATVERLLGLELETVTVVVDGIGS
jgi:uncharacterized alkaline shock family protein YloU